MPEITAELRKPRRLHIHGKLWSRGVKTPIDAAMATKLFGDVRFKLKGLSHHAAAMAEDMEDRPKGEALLDAITDAIGQLDEDNDTHFTRSGKPDHRALSDILGYPITEADRDKAMKNDVSPRFEPADKVVRDRALKPTVAKPPLKLAKRTAPESVEAREAKLAQMKALDDKGLIPKKNSGAPAYAVPPEEAADDTEEDDEEESGDVDDKGGVAVD